MENVFEYRFDRADVISYTEENGFFKAKVRLVKPGVYHYLLNDGSIRKEAKLPEEIFNPIFLKSLDGIPITDGHPYAHGGLVNSENYNQLMKGIITNPRIEDGFVVADETLFDSALIASVKAGEKREVSLGLKVKYLDQAGNFSGAVYDSIQTEMRANHMAHVVKARVGDAKIILDGIEYGIQQGEIMAEDVVDAEPTWLKGFFEKLVKTITETFTASEKKVEVLVPKLVSDSADKTSPVTTEKAIYEKKISELEATIKDITNGISLKLDEAVARDGIVDAVKAVLPDSDLKGKTNSEIKTILIKSILPEVKLDNADLIDLYYNASLELAKAKAKLNPGKVEVKQDSADLAALKAKRLNFYQEVK